MLSRDEAALVELAKTDQAAFGQLFDAYYGAISNYVVHRVGDMAVAEDIISITFFKAWQNLPKFQWKNVPFGAWLYRIAGNEVNTYFRQNKRSATSLEALFEATGYEPASEHTVEADAIDYENQLQIHHDFLVMQRLIMDLPIKYQEVLSLRFFEKKSLAEISDITGKNLNTVKSLLSRGTAQCRTAFAEQAQQPVQLLESQDVI